MHEFRLDARVADGAPWMRDTVATRVARSLLVALALVLPFEAPPLRVGALQMTPAELVLYVALAAWVLAAAWRLARDPSAVKVAAAEVRAEPVTLAAIAWCLVELASAAAAAPSIRASSLKFALRTISGVLAFFAARSLTRPLAVGRRVLVVLVVGALLSVAAEFLFGLRRGNAAMYWAAVLPLVVVFPLEGSRAHEHARPAAWTVFALLGAALLVLGVLASPTRWGLAGSAAASATFFALAWWRRANEVRGVAGAVLGMLAASCAVAVMSARAGSLLGPRLEGWHDTDWFGVEYLVDTEPRTVQADELFYVPVTLRNTGTIGWPHSGDHPTHLSYHWERLAAPATQADYEGARTELPADIPPGGVLELLATARGPNSAGTYRLRWDVVQERVTWFSDQGNAMPDQAFEVLPWPGSPPPPPSIKAAPSLAFDPPSRPLLWRAALVLWRSRPLLGIGPGNFSRLYYAAPSPAPGGRPDSGTRKRADFYVETLANLGLAGVLVLVWLAVALVRLLRTHAKAGNLLGLGAGVAAGAFFVHGAFDSLFEFMPPLGPFWVLLGVTVAARAEPPSDGAPRDNRG